jgi:hypothetical protein
MTNFRHIRWASHPDHMAARFHDYRRLMDHWRAVLPVELFEVNYEDTVTDLEGVARRLVAWCGLEWQPACLAFHQTSRPIRCIHVRWRGGRTMSRPSERFSDGSKAILPQAALGNSLPQ